MPADAYVLWTECGLSCRLGRTLEGWRVSVEADGGEPFLRRYAYSKGDAANQAEYLRLLLDRARAGTRAPHARQPLILIVEDDPENLFTYEETLRIEGFRTASAPTLADARRLLGEVRPAAILLDHVLPDGDGPALARELRASLGDAAIPIVLVTGMDPIMVADEYAGGADALLCKPCRPETLTGVLKLVAQRVTPRAAEP
jgi:CheY-like chemotaxis protein